ncbi:MAG: sigma-54-dependent Fis family transcriptional regulator [candidate division Zixibacteria bacterium]|nr:sigma-54-dependent Fis family transcriptional regulator [candidate division Zixibacteria bacterium]
MSRILIIDDEEKIRSSLKAALERRGHEIVTAENFKKGSEYAGGEFDVTFLDVLLPDGNGLDLLRAILTHDRWRIVVMISGHASIDTAVEAIRLGAYDFIEKPISLDRVLITVDNAAKTSNLISEKNRLASQLYGEFVGESEPIRRLKNDIARSAPKTTRFLILGENGTGKELVAHLIHHRGQYAEGPFVAVNCAALPSELVEAELFGHTVGAYTGAGKARKGRFVEAHRGSIFLDEISEMRPAAQAKILRVVETRQVTPVGADKPVEVEGNIIAASNRDLEHLAGEEKFRQDLLYRLNVVQFKIPPLRQRRDDIPLLAEYFLNRFTVETKTGPKRFTPEALAYLQALPYPGNTRELKNLVERLNIYTEAEIISPTDIKRLAPPLPDEDLPNLKDAVSAFERDFIRAAIDHNGGNITMAARELGLERSHLYKKLKKLDDSETS